MDDLRFRGAPSRNIEDRRSEPPPDPIEAQNQILRAIYEDRMGLNQNPMPAARPPYSPLQRDAGAEALDHQQPLGVALSSAELPLTRLSQVQPANAPAPVQQRTEEQANLEQLATWRRQADSLLRRGLISPAQYREIMVKMGGR